MVNRHWEFERVAGPYQGATGGVAWDGEAVYFSAVGEGRILRFHPKTGKVDEYRRYTNRVNGIGFGANGEFFGCQEGSRRIVQFMPDGSTLTTATWFDGKLHNHPSDLAVDAKGRVWFSDPYHPVPPLGLYRPPLPHASVLRLERDQSRAWRIVRVTFDTQAPRAVLLSSDEKTLYLAEGDKTGDRCSLRAYPVREDSSVGTCVELHAFGKDHRGVHRGIEGLCLESEGNLVAVGGSGQSGPGPLVYVFSPNGAVLETHPLPFDAPMRCAFGDADLATLYVTSADGALYRAKTERKGSRKQKMR